MFTINVKVVPRSSIDAVVGPQGDALKVKLTAAPEHGKANKSLVKVLAHWLGVKPSQVVLKSGHHAQQKLVEINAVDFQQYQQKLSKL